MSARTAARRSGRAGELHPRETVSRCVPSSLESKPTSNLEVAPPGSRAPSFFPGSGQSRLHRRRVYCVEPELNSFHREHHQASLYLHVSLTCSLCVPRSLPPWTSPRRRRSPSPGRLRSPQLLPTTQVRTTDLPCAHASLILVVNSSYAVAPFSRPEPAAACRHRAATVHLRQGLDHP